MRIEPYKNKCYTLKGQHIFLQITTVRVLFFIVFHLLNSTYQQASTSWQTLTNRQTFGNLQTFTNRQTHFLKNFY